ncbi:uncharacterized protein LOC113211242 isoform X1 [Frankliniella occidentalis]|uniref:Uncharacterized protein LOC113211242 isoform X1 n=1 Tax=Frankliniella occidentalis TaxID=133901 RepID=A0A9C6WYB1_FRAOC|nr:uncharacterized protein LOC113211242 isoform X1 [Frankliniella occidentalis]XP_052124041.1 uncharacterized protein LOC113211242 isoform X1 [Frankliniella occidentalis]
MELLPDNVLLEVMQCLDLADLLACRLVCRRLGALAMLPEAWRHQSLDLVCIDDGYGLNGPRHNECAVLQLAPCLREWELIIPLEKFHTLYTTTRCAVHTLTFCVEEMSGKDALQVSLLIRNQAALGRLRRLSIGSHVWRSTMDAEDAAVLLGTVAATTSCLEELQLLGFDCYPPSTLAGLHRSFPGASLKSFEHDLEECPEAEPFCEFILSTHATTLESVKLGCYYFTSTSTAALLAGIPNLRSLQCGMMPGLEAVAGCEQLRDLELCVAYDGEALAAAEFLRRATQLVKVTLDYDEVGMAPSLDVDFVLALTATEHSRLEALSIKTRDGGPFPQQQSLLKALPHLPALKHLEVHAEATDELLLGSTPATAPALRTLKVSRIDVKCAHDALHRDAVQKLMSLNPDLKFFTYKLSYCYTDDRCAWCSLGCHQEMRDDSGPPPKYCANYATIPRL